MTFTYSLRKKKTKCNEQLAAKATSPGQELLVRRVDTTTSSWEGRLNGGDVHDCSMLCLVYIKRHPSSILTLSGSV